MTDNRMGLRSLCADLVKLEWIDDSGSLQTLQAVLEDISPQGACLQVEAPVPEARQAFVSHAEKWAVPCRIKYCVFREIGYYVGLEFDDSARWSESHYLPEHLLNLEELVRTSAKD